MKINKKIIVSSLASAMAISMVAAISGTVAWYQYNTAVRASLIGTNVADTGILEISADGTNWKSTLTTSDYSFAGGRTNTKITPVTFYGSDSYDGDDALPATAYTKPNFKKNWTATNKGSYSEVFQAASAETDYIQYTIQLRAKTVDNTEGGLTQKAENVYLTAIHLADVGSGLITSGMRIHLAIDANGDDTPEKYVLLNKAGTSVATQLSGKLNLDDEIHEADWVYSDGWGISETKEVITYGAAGKTQTTAVSPLDASMTGDALFTVPASGAAKITVTLWLEGWDASVGAETIYQEKVPTAAVGSELESGLFTRSGATYTAATGNRVAGVTYYEVASSSAPMWSGLNTDGAQFNFGLEFSVKDDAFVD